MKKLWSLAVSVFLIASGCGLFLLAWIFTGGRLDTAFSGILLYVVLALVVFGIAKGVYTIFSRDPE